MLLTGVSIGLLRLHWHLVLQLCYQVWLQWP